MKTQRKPVETVAVVGQILENMQQFKDAIDDQMQTLLERFPAAETEPTPVSQTLVMHHCREALRLARGLPAAPHARQRIQSAYRLVCAELGVEE